MGAQSKKVRISPSEYDWTVSIEFQYFGKDSDLRLGKYDSVHNHINQSWKGHESYRPVQRWLNFYSND